MKAMVFAAGIGSRLKAITAATPKSLVDIGGGRTMLGTVLTQLSRAGVSEVIINLFHLPHLIEEYLKQNEFGVKISYSREETLLGTGGGLKKAAWFFNDGKPFIVHNSDIYTNLDLTQLYKAHLQNNTLGTLAVMSRPTSRHLLFDEENELIGWENKGIEPTIVRASKQQHRWAFSGIQVISPEIFDYMHSHDGEFSIITAYLSATRAGRKIKGFDMSSSYWIDMGTPEKLLELKNRLKGEV